LFNEAAVRACGTMCETIYGSYPGVAPADYPHAAKKIASFVLESMAERGNGIYQEFLDGEVAQLSLGALDYSSLASRNVLKSLYVQALTSVPAGAQREVDSDGDGLVDAQDVGLTLGTNPYLLDSDGDCFDDGLEVLKADEGFIPANDLDARGCDPASPLTPGCFCRDTDGDGLSQFAEAYLGTRAGLPDTDGDGVIDGTEVRFGLAPTQRTVRALDTDSDGESDYDEIRANTHPGRLDRGLFDRDGYRYNVAATEQADGSVCYDFTVTNLKLLTPPARAGRLAGYNLFKLYFAEAPESGVATDYGVWRAACAWARYEPPRVRVPLASTLDVSDGDFHPLEDLVTEADLDARCLGVAP
jgi:hypothetical protein